MEREPIVTIVVPNKGKKEVRSMKIAIPLSGGTLSAHFGRSEEFAILEVDTGEKKILKTERIPAPPHQPGLLPRWLHARGVEVIIASGMGRRALSFFADQEIGVVVGAPPDGPEAIAQAYLGGELQSSENVCDHRHSCGH